MIELTILPNAFLCDYKFYRSRIVLHTCSVNIVRVYCGKINLRGLGGNLKKKVWAQNYLPGQEVKPFF